MKNYDVLVVGSGAGMNVASSAYSRRMTVAVVENVEIFIPLSGLIDVGIEKVRLDKEIKRLEGQIFGLEKKLSNDQFLTKAPDQIVKQEREKLKNFSNKLNKIKTNLNQLN